MKETKGTVKGRQLFLTKIPMRVCTRMANVMVLVFTGKEIRSGSLGFSFSMSVFSHSCVRSRKGHSKLCCDF